MRGTVLDAGDTETHSNWSLPTKNSQSDRHETNVLLGVQRVKWCGSVSTCTGEQEDS